MIISDFPVMIALSDKFPDFSYTGEYTILDDGSESGVKQVAFLTSGTLTTMDDARVTVQAQGAGGGGGAGNSSTSGSDGADGTVVSKDFSLPAGEYTIDIGAAGTKGNQSAGGDGGDTTFDDLLFASGGAGGARNGAKTLEHAGLYSSYGQGGVGGTKSMYTGSYSAASYCIKLNAATIYTTPDTNGTVYMRNNNSLWQLGTTTYPSTITGTDGNSFYRLMDSRYVLTSQCGTPYLQAASDTRKWYGTDGYPGIVILSGKA